MTMPPYTITQDSITIIWNGKAHTVQKGAPNFQALRAAIVDERVTNIEKNLTVSKSLSEWAKGKFVFVNNQVSYEGSPLPENLNRRLLTMAANGEDPTPVFKFWERLQKNPSMRSVEQLWPFLEHSGIPLTSDGCFLAYKGINHDFTDKHTGTVDNKPGVINEMPRNKISDDPREPCHYGYHVGALAYAQNFAPGGRMVICKVDPADVVCVPYDESMRKMRVCKYEVVGHHNGQPLSSTTHAEDPMTENELKLNQVHECEECEGTGMTPDGDSCECPAGDEDADDEDLESEDGEDVPFDKISDLMAKEADEGLMPVNAVDNSPVTKMAEKRKANKAWAKFDNMAMEELMNQSIADLRQYAGQGLLIVGASKIPGGKMALISKILEVRA